MDNNWEHFQKCKKYSDAGSLFLAPFNKLLTEENELKDLHSHLQT